MEKKGQVDPLEISRTHRPVVGAGDRIPDRPKEKLINRLHAYIRTYKIVEHFIYFHIHTYYNWRSWDVQNIHSLNIEYSTQRKAQSTYAIGKDFICQRVLDRRQLRETIGRRPATVGLVWAGGGVHELLGNQPLRLQLECRLRLLPLLGEAVRHGVDH